MTNSTTKHEQNGIDTIVIWSECCGRLAFVDEQYYRDVESEWEELKSILKSYNPIDYDEINNNYIYDLENGKKLIKEYDEILKVFDEKINHKINEVKNRQEKGTAGETKKGAWGIAEKRFLMSTPCINCTERHPLCHDTCEKYKTYTLEQEERKAIIRKAKMKQSIIDDYQMRAIERVSEKRYGRR